jgi:Fe-S cluster biogenesis protein NfuA
MEQNIKTLIEEEINPQLKIHAAGVHFHKLEDNVLFIKIMGGCSGCPSSALALFKSIYPQIKDKFPSLRDVRLERS